MADLVLVRAGQSKLLRESRFDGISNSELSDFGIMESVSVGSRLKIENYSNLFRKAFTSSNKSAIKSLEVILATLCHASIPVIKTEMLNERNYGELEGMTGDEARAKYGEEKVTNWYCSYNQAPPKGESLKDVVTKASNFFEKEIKPALMNDENVIVVCNYSSARALAMKVEELSENEVIKMGFPPACCKIYELMKNGKFKSFGHISAEKELAKAYSR